MNLQRQMIYVLALVTSLTTNSALAAVEALEGVATNQVTAVDVQELIARLGAKEFAVRERAQLELSKLGFVAFESLEEVRDHDDFEIRVRVRRLLDGLRGPLMMAPGIARLESLLSGYTLLDEEERAVKIEKVAALEPEDALPVLTRFARFEESLELAKRSAILAMQLEYPTQPAKREALADDISIHCGLSKRTSVVWLRAFAASLNEPEQQLGVWKQIQASAENDNLPSETLRGISQVHMDILARAGEKEAAFDLAKQVVNMGVEGRQDIAEVADWILKRDLMELFDRFYEANRNEFEADRTLLYRLAEAQVKHGDRETAEETARRAFEIEPDAQSVATRDWIWQNFQSRDSIHTTVANTLRDRGFFAWAEREYRASIQLKMQPHFVYIKSHVWLSEMLHDQQDDKNAGDVLDSLLKEYQKDAEIKKAFAAFEQQLTATQARAHFFHACHYRAQNDLEREMMALEKGIKASPYDADVLIAMHRVRGAPDEWYEKTRSSIRIADKNAMKAIENARVAWERSNGRESARRNLTQKLNDYAWLVGNTIGDGEQAIRFSHDSLELEPGTPGYLDTLGRCYYRMGEYEEAVRYQRQAVRRDPHSGQLLRQLELFESALNQEEASKRSQTTEQGD